MPSENDLKFPIHPTKRTFDVIFSGTILILLAPVIFLFFVIIALEQTIRLRPFDPLLYSEIRMSQGRCFRLYKFNIFKHAIISDMRRRNEFIYTKQLERAGSLLFIGKILKQVYLDELPQFFNILKGDMSVVGPRPVNTEVHKLLQAQGSTYKDMVRAGLTGYYQQQHKYNRCTSQNEADKEYVEYYFTNPWYKILYFDIMILLRTIKVVLLAKGI
ncbi:MAG: sugar transferase [Candidatus Pacebacteria bacterium]|nr:sugar transferase [Candidatus Paceibacterota bacterium]MCF7857279.1 sugar transferase [Candidatus Paceibacterota bacterium]